jgi:amino acid transporter
MAVAEQVSWEQSPPDQQLERNTLGLAEVVMAGLVQIAPAFSVAFTAALIAGIAGASVPFVFLLAMVGVLATGNSLAQFSRLWPSSGSFVTFISRALDPRVGVAATSSPSPASTSSSGASSPPRCSRAMPAGCPR